MARSSDTSRAFVTDTIRTVEGSLKRFLAIVAITSLGVIMAVGLRASCVDLRQSADAFFDDQGLFDLRVQSTLGLTDEDVEAILDVTGVEDACGSWVETVYTAVGSGSEKVDVKVVSPGMNEPLVLEGRLPEKDDEIAVTRRFLDDSGLAIGDTVSFRSEADSKAASDDEEDDDDDSILDEDEDTTVFERKDYVIVGSVLDPTDINAGEGSMSFRSSGSSQYSFFVSEDCVVAEVYTIIYVRVAGGITPLCYSDDYEDLVAEVKGEIESGIKEARERARGESVRADANATIDDAEAEALSELADAEQELNDAQDEIDDGWAQLEDGKEELTLQEALAVAELDKYQAQIDDGYAQLAAAEVTLRESQAELDDGLAQLEEGEATLRESQAQVDDGLAQLEEGKAQADAEFAAQWQTVAESEELLAESRAQIEAAGAEVASNALVADVWPAEAWERLVTTNDPDEARAAAAEVNAALDSFVSEATSAIDAVIEILDSADDASDALDAWAEENLSPEAKQALEDILAGAYDDDIRAALEAWAEENLETEEEKQAFYDLLDELEGSTGDEAKDVLTDAIVRALPEEYQDIARQYLGEDTDQLRADLVELRDQISQFSQLADYMVQIVEGESELAAGKEQLAAAEEEVYAEIEANRALLVDAQAQIDAGWAEVASNRALLADGQAQIDAGWAEVASNRALLDESAAELAEQRASALKQIEDAWAEIWDNELLLIDGQAELDDGWATFISERDDALEKIADARLKVADVADATWYVQDRSSLSSYASVESDASSIEAIGTVLPVVFFAVAILISLTTMTRMVEEERTLIGLYKALGYSRGRILSKYVLYALAACLIGGVVGNVLGFFALPAILFTIFQTMYAVPEFFFCYDVVYSLGSVVLFAVGIVGATAFTCRRELQEVPASLMRPKAPKAGSRIFLERIGFVWRRLNFLNKVTARNIFRYKRRFLMTVVGIAGCTALLICGFGIRDTVFSLSERQYDEGGVTKYDLMVVTSADDLDDVEDDLMARNLTTDVQRVRIDSVTADFGDGNESVTMIVVPNGVDLTDFNELWDDNGATVDLGDRGLLITKNAEQVLGFALGDTIHLQDSNLNEATAEVTGTVVNYLGNMAFMTESAYEAAFGQECEQNGLLAHLSGEPEDQIAFSEELSRDSRYLSVSSTQKLKDSFSSAFTLINTVVYVVIVLAAALSFTVVFTLSNTNISERERELATIKVLGFKRGEVHVYINKETLILTGLGVILGIPSGYLLTRSLTYILRMPSLYFDAIVEPMTYLIAAILAFVFTILVNLITDRSLDRIDMVGALKSAE